MSSVAKAKRPMSAGRAKKVAKNSLVHIILGILAVPDFLDYYDKL